MSHQPPKILTSLITTFCKRSLWEAIEGDLYELYQGDYEEVGKKKARANYFFNAVAFLRYQRLRKTQNSNTNMSLMKNYVKVSFRDLLRHKTFTTINLIGLVGGMTVSLLILQYVFFETSFDNFHKDGDRIYRVINDRYQNGELVQHGTITYPTIGPTLKKDFPEVEAYTRMTISWRNNLTYQGEIHLSDQMLWADEHFLNFFSFELLEGDAKTCLDAPYKVVLTETQARALLEGDQPLSELIGELIDFNDTETPFKITGILKDLPENSHLQFDLLASYKTFIARAGEGADNSWGWSDFYHYVKLQENVAPASLDQKLADFGVRYFKEGEVSGGEEEFYLQPLAKAHLDHLMEYEIGEVTNGKVIWLMLAVAIFIMVIAWINYINLNTSRAIQRAKEVGVRKSMGAQRRQIVSQFIVETLLVNLLSLVVSLIIVAIIQPFFNQLTGELLGLGILFGASIAGIPFPLLFLFILIFCSTLIALYPAYLINKFNTQDIIKGSFRLKGEIVWLRKGLVVFQFCIAIILITASITISRQVTYMVNKDLGIDINNTLVLHGPGNAQFDSTFIPKIEYFKTELGKLSGVEMVTASNRVVGEQMGRVFQIKSSADPEANNLTSNFIFTDHQFTSLYNVEMVAGRAFTAGDHNMDGRNVKNILVNEEAINLLKFANASDAVGKSVDFWGKTWTIVGVVNDFHQKSLHSPIEPIFMIPYYETGQYYSLKLTSEPNEGLLSRVQGLYDQVFPGNYFDYYFLKDQYLLNYQADVQMGKVSQVFTFLSILIASLGLYGLIMMTILKRTKEIGVRKVLGANLTQILSILTKEFLLLIGVAMVIGVPLSYLLLNKWQQGFAYANELGWDTIVLGIALILTVYFTIILFQVKKISSNNPVESLRYE